MPGFGAEVSHELGQQAAIERLQHFAERIGEKYKDQVKGVEQSWKDNVLNFSFKTFGAVVSGAVTVEEETVKLDGKLPFTLVAFRGKIEQSIREALEKALAKS